MLSWWRVIIMWGMTWADCSHQVASHTEKLKTDFTTTYDWWCCKMQLLTHNWYNIRWHKTSKDLSNRCQWHVSNCYHFEATINFHFIWPSELWILDLSSLASYININATVSIINIKRSWYLLIYCILFMIQHLLDRLESWFNFTAADQTD